MTQTANGQKGPTSKTTQKLTRPGQRQQERLQRLARRRRRRQITVSAITAALIVVAGIVGVIQYQAYTARQHDASVAATGTASAKANATGTVAANVTATAGVHATSTAVANVILTTTSGSPIPSAGPATPPPTTATPVKLADGLQYIDIKQGTGPAAQQGGTVTVEYTGWLQSNGKKFDSSYDHGAQPFDVTPLGQAQIIPGWNEGLVGVKAGGVRRLIIPPALGYGAQGAPPTIPANSVLIFDVTIIAVK